MNQDIDHPQFNEVKPTVFLVGVGHIGSALAQRWQKTIPEQLRLVAKDQAQKQKLLTAFPDAAILLPEDVLEAFNGLKTQAILVLGVRHEQFHGVLAEYKPLWQLDNKPLIISLTGKSTIEEISEATNGATVLRAVPNIASAYGTGCTTILRTRSLDRKHLELAANLFAVNGSVHIFDEKSQFEIASRIAGASLAFFFKVASLLEQNHSAPYIKEALISASQQCLSEGFSVQEKGSTGTNLQSAVMSLELSATEVFLKIRDALAKAACLLGLQPTVSAELSRSALQGAASVAENSNFTMQDHITRIATPGGITEAMLRSLETQTQNPATLDSMMRNAIHNGVTVSTRK